MEIMFKEPARSRDVFSADTTKSKIWPINLRKTDIFFDILVKEEEERQNKNI